MPVKLRILLLISLFCANAYAQELRALWVDAFHNGYFNSTQTTALIADARAAKCNAIIVEVRKRGDAYYQGGIEPVATNVSPQTFDPLADLIQKGHTGSPRIEVHAWVVAYNIWGSQNTPPAQPTHPYNLHPAWLTQKIDGTQWDGSNYLFDPAHPAVQRHTFDVCMDIISRYNVDGLHLDYIRYPDAGSSGGNQPWGYNPVSVARYKKLTSTTATPPATDPAWLQWRRSQITALVRKIYLNTWATKPGVRLSAALITYGNPPADLTLASWQSREAYSRTLQDWRGWMEEGILDLACPMIYRDESTTAGFNGWADFAKDRKYNRAAAPGMGWYLNTVPNTHTQIALARDPTPAGNTAAGLVGYSYAVPNDDGTTQSSMWAQLASGPFAATATVPAMPWKTSIAKGHAMSTLTAADTGEEIDGATITLTGPSNRTLLTDATGFWGAVDLPVGTYTLTVSQPGYIAKSRTFTVTGSSVAQPDTTLQIIPFQITSTTRNAATLTIAWNTVPGRAYRLEKSDDLKTWTTASASLTANAASTSYVWPIPAGWETRGFLRVAQEP